MSESTSASAPVPSAPARAHEDERRARCALSRLAEPGDPRLLGLVAELGAVRLHELLLTERDLHGLQTDVAARLADCDPVRDLERAMRLGIRFVVPGDEEWPTTIDDLVRPAPLHDRGGPPVGLWVKGPVRLDSLAHSVAIVGSRSASSYGAQAAGDIAGTLARAGLPVVSGAAFGIDQAAHRGALVGEGTTVAVLACGADRIYPAAHENLLVHLGREGAVVSESPPGGAPTRIRFLARNRLIAALTCGTVVVEAAIRSGALSTAGWAERLHRHVLAVPGPITSATSQGAHQLIRRGAAVLVTGGRDVLEVVGTPGEHLLEDQRAPATRRDRLTRVQRQVLDAVPKHEGAPTPSVARAAGLGLVEVRSALHRLAHLGLAMESQTGWRLAEEADQVAG